jgi:hypothetical protein
MPTSRRGFDVGAFNLLFDVGGVVAGAPVVSIPFPARVGAQGVAAPDHGLLLQVGDVAVG